MKNKRNSKEIIIGRQYGYRSNALRAIHRFQVKYFVTIPKHFQFWVNKIDEGCFEIAIKQYKMNKENLGDAVYVEMENGMIKLTTEDGYRTTNEIYLELDVRKALIRYMERINILTIT